MLVRLLKERYRRVNHLWSDSGKVVSWGSLFWYLSALSLMALAVPEASGQVCYSFSDATATQPATMVANVTISAIPASLVGAGTDLRASFSSGTDFSGSNFSPENMVTITYGGATYSFNSFGITISDGGSTLTIGGIGFPFVTGSPNSFTITFSAFNSQNIFPQGLTTSIPPITIDPDTGAPLEGGEVDESKGPTGFEVQIQSLGSACANSTPTLIDPVSDLLMETATGTQITTALTATDSGGGPTYLANPMKGRLVKGLATDGVAQVVIRIPAAYVGQAFSLSIGDGLCPFSVPECSEEFGLLFDPAHPPENVFTTTLQDPVVVYAQSTETGPVAFAAYRAPIDFITLVTPENTDQTAAQRSIVIGVNNDNYPGILITLVRPPVILIHGTFSNSHVFDNFSPVVGNGIFSATKLDYSQDIDSEVTSTLPDYTDTRPGAHIKRNVLGVEYNARLLLDDMVTAITIFKSGRPPVNIPVAAVRADIVAHSLGGLMARGMTHVGTTFLAKGSKFYEKGSYEVGYIHKLITLGTPHLGTNLALLTVNGTNNCTRHAAARFGNYSLTSAVIDGQSYWGAALDQAGDPTEGLNATLGPTLSLLNAPSSLTIPTAFIATTFSAANNDPALLSAYGTAAKTFCGTETIIETLHGPSITFGSHCGTLPPCPAHGAEPVGCCKVRVGDFLADNYSFDDWHNIFKGDASDVIVPFASATLAQSVYTIRDGVVHGPGTVGAFASDGPHLGFAGPQLLDPTGPIPAIVLQLLNTSVKDGSKFVNIP